MKKIVAAVCLLGLGLFGCLEAPEQRPDDSQVVVSHSGIIEKLADAFVIVDETELGTRFFPLNLPDEFRSDGLMVIFSGRAQEIPPNVTLVGTPLELSAIEHDVR